jgi:hypothetical protein
LNFYSYAVDAELGRHTICDWNEIIAPTPMGIAFVIQLVISASQLSDVGIDQIDNKDIPLIKHPHSFCTTMTQIADEGF